MSQPSRDDTLAASHLYKQCEASKWFEESECSSAAVLGVAIRRPDHNYLFEPASIDELMMVAIRSIGPRVAFSMSSEITSTIFSQISPYQTELIIQPRGTRIPIVDSLRGIPDRSFEIRQSLACLVKKENIVLVLANTPEGALSYGSDVEQMLMEIVWGSSFGTPRALSRPEMSTRFSYISHESLSNSASQGRSESTSTRFSRPQTPGLTQGPKRVLDKEKCIRTRVAEIDADQERFVDPEAANTGHMKRPMILMHSLMVGLTLIILIAIEGIVISKVVVECKYDQKFGRIGYLAVVPVFAGFAFCSALLVIFSIFQVFGPTRDNLNNSRYYSPIAPTPAKFKDIELPHITIQIPVYMESLKAVIIPTIASIKVAIKYYEKVGGTASIYINDDGMQIVHPDVADARRRYYAANHIGWCARPPHGERFVRKGRFKKASNMNYGLSFSNRVEDELLRLVARLQDITQTQDITLEQENELYQQALDTVIASDEGKTMASGNVCLGEFILLVDCDTRVPETCLHMGALEMIESPSIAIIQHTSDVLRVAHNVFETGISYLTDLTYTAIAFNVGSGDCPCFVGHNAFLRWKAVQSVSFEEDGMTKYWSESHVSEDFHLSIRLQIAGFEIRLASYHGEDFKEGVSLSVFDELARWEKYAYGTNELVFNPLIKWYKGPITHLYLSYFMSNVKASSKLMVLSYTFTYYAIAIGLPLTLANYLIVGWFPNTLDQFYVASWKFIVVILIIFNIISPIAYCIIRFRLGKQRLLDSIIQTVSWSPLIVLFFSGISFHLSKALLCHFVGINIEWTATAKELETTGFFIGMDRIIKDFKYMYITVGFITGGMVYLGVYAPYGWTITNWTTIFPLALQLVGHSLLPLALGLF